jgi:hypothetical protein
MLGIPVKVCHCVCVRIYRETGSRRMLGIPVKMCASRDRESARVCARERARARTRDKKIERERETR